MIHVCYALYDKNGKYSKLTGTSICSLFENTKAWVTIHLLHDHTLTEENRAKFIQLARKYGNHIVFYDMEELMQEQREELLKWGFAGRYSPAALYRLLLMRVLPENIKRVIYFDGDTIIHCDIQDLWHEEVGENGLAAVPECSIFHGTVETEAKPICADGIVEVAKYFNSGVLLIDMDAYRQHSDLLRIGGEFLSAHPKCTAFDQDILNYVFAAQFRALDVKYNTFVITERIKARKVTASIYHYAMQTYKTWGGIDAYTQLFNHYYQQSPWYEDTQLAIACHESLLFGVQLCADLFKKVQGRRVVFCGKQEVLPMIQKYLAVFPETLFLNIFSQERNLDLLRLIQNMRQLCNKKPTFFIFIDMRFSGGGWSHYIEESGFQPEQDFADGTALIQAIEGQAISASHGLLFRI